MQTWTIRYRCIVLFNAGSIIGKIVFVICIIKLQVIEFDRLAEANALQCVKTLIDLNSVVETYDMKVAVENKGKIDIRLKFVGDKPSVMAVRKDDEKVLISDILCFHR